MDTSLALAAAAKALALARISLARVLDTPLWPMVSSSFAGAGVGSSTWAGLSIRARAAASNCSVLEMGGDDGGGGEDDNAAAVGAGVVDLGSAGA